MQNRTFFSAALALAVAGALTTACGDDDDTNPQGDAGNDVANDVSETSEAGTDGGPDVPLRVGIVDRAGRVGTVELLTTKDDWNRSDTFDLDLVDPLQLDVDMQRNLARLDLADSVDDWDGGSPDGSAFDGGTVYMHPLISVLRTDVLTVDTRRPFSPAGYLEIENHAFVLGTPGAQATCGGRWLADDAVDKQLSFVVKKSLTGVSDGVAAATKPPTLTFPYLADPN